MSDVEAKQFRHNAAFDAAVDVFTRRGYARTTMAEIAEKAKMSRPALYLIFPSKEDAFSTVVQRMNEAQLAAISQAMTGLATFHEQLLHACTTWGSHGVDLTEAHPDAKDLFDISLAPVKQMYVVFEDFLADMLTVPLARSACSFTPRQLARTLTYALRGLKQTAADSADMRTLIGIQVALVIAALASSRGD